jgi:hypothetical protein
MTDLKLITGLNLADADKRNIDPYSFTIDGASVLTFTDPALLDWQLLEGLDGIDTLAEQCMSDDDRRIFYGTPLAAYKLALLFQDVMRHFEIGEHQQKRRPIK